MSSCVSAVLISLECNKLLSPRQLKHITGLHYITGWIALFYVMVKSNNNLRSFKVKLLKAGRKHLKCTEIAVEKYLKDVQRRKALKMQKESDHTECNIPSYNTCILSSMRQITP